MDKLDYLFEITILFTSLIKIKFYIYDVRVRSF